MKIYVRILPGRDIPIGYNHVIQVDDISSYGTRVEVSRVPFNINNDMLKMMLQSYGDVYKCQNYFRKFGDYSNLNKTGDRVVWMKLKKQIPQSLRINKTEMNIYVKYSNQPMTCNRCGSVGHRARFCSLEPKDYKNIIEIKEN